MKKTKIDVEKELAILDESITKVEHGIKTTKLSKNDKKQLAERLNDVIKLAELAKTKIAR